ncbi:MAG: RagB/SusD family nutrient uptake outer membrane protein [Chitinophagaceae bacterium]
MPVMRYAEVLLNYAEASARTGALADAAALLNAVRKRSDATYSFSSADLASQTALTNLVITERRIELLGEGFRVPDVQRLMLPIPGKAALSCIAPTSDPTATLYIWPISSEELGTNKLMTPN